MCHVPQNNGSGPAEDIGWVPGSTRGLMGKEDGRRERVFCSGAICGPWYSIEHTGQLLQNKERIRGGHKCCDGSELLIYS